MFNRFASKKKKRKKSAKFAESRDPVGKLMDNQTDTMSAVASCVQVNKEITNSYKGLLELCIMSQLYCDINGSGLLVEMDDDRTGIDSETDDESSGYDPFKLGQMHKANLN